MIQFEVPAIVPADPQANVTDLLVERVEGDAASSRCSPSPTATAGATSPPPSSTTRSSPSRRASSPPASSPATRSASSHDHATSGRWSTSRLCSPARCMVPIYETSSPAQIAVEPHRLGRDRAHRRDRPTTSPASTRCAPTLPLDPHRSGRCDLGDLDKLVAQGTDVHGRRDRAPPQHRRTAPTSRPSSTRRARPAARRAACSRTATSSS